MQRTFKTAILAILLLTSAIPAMADNVKAGIKEYIPLAHGNWYVIGCDPSQNAITIAEGRFGGSGLFVLHPEASVVLGGSSLERDSIIKLVKLDGCTGTFWIH